MKKRIAILGGGPAGLGLAVRILSRHPEVELLIFEKKSQAGGLAISFERNGLYFDYGSHRLHPATEPEILDDIKGLLGGDLLDRPRNGRIRLLGKFVKFPLSPVDLALNLPPSFVSGIVLDSTAKLMPKRKRSFRTFADFLLDGLGPTVCNQFYFPYARKLWGLDPKEIDAEQAQRRVSANSFSKMAMKLLNKLPGVGRRGAGRFFYPRRGFGQIAEKLADAVQQLGGTILTSAEAVPHEASSGGSEGDNECLVLTLNGGHSIKVRFDAPPSNLHTSLTRGELPVDYIFSTIPITSLARCLSPQAPADIIEAVRSIRYRSMVLFYLILETDQFTPFDAHYFPGEDVVFSRLSETKNYYHGNQPKGLTGLCLEIPCSTEDAVWRMADTELCDLLAEQLAASELPVKSPIRECFSIRIDDVYPIYDIGYEPYFRKALDFVNAVPNLISLGRQGLFMHNNTHHSLAMAYRAGECLTDNLSWNQTQWASHLEAFSQFVVED